MLLAFVTICFTGSSCVEFNDTRGPYDNLAQCQVRVVEMLYGLKAMYPQARLVATGCRNIDEEV